MTEYFMTQDLLEMPSACSTEQRPRMLGPVRFWHGDTEITRDEFYAEQRRWMEAE